MNRRCHLGEGGGGSARRAMSGELNVISCVTLKEQWRQVKAHSEVGVQSREGMWNHITSRTHGGTEVPGLKKWFGWKVWLSEKLSQGRGISFFWWVSKVRFGTPVEMTEKHILVYYIFLIAAKVQRYFWLLLLGINVRNSIILTWLCWCHGNFDAVLQCSDKCSVGHLGMLYRRESNFLGNSRI